MKETLDLGPAPADEPCEQVGTREYDPDAALRECRRFLTLLRKTFGPEPGSARLRVKSHSHDFGVYYEVVCEFDDADGPAIDYAFRCERDAPTTWEKSPTVPERTPSP